jgi:hypothetical protein
VAVQEYGIIDLQYIAAGAAILAGGGGGSYGDAVNVLDELAATGWRGTIQARDYDGATPCCVPAMMGSPDAAVSMTPADVENSIANTVSTFEQATGATLGCVIPVEIGNLNESLIMYSSLSSVPDIIAPDSICYYSESGGRGFSNATDDLAGYFDPDTGKSTGRTVSIIKVGAAPKLCGAPGVAASFAGLLRRIGYAGALAYSG